MKEGRRKTNYVVGVLTAFTVVFMLTALIIVLQRQQTRETTTYPIFDKIKEALEFDSIVREVAIDVLRSYANKSYVVLEERVKVPAGRSNYLSFRYYYPLIYELTISVTGKCLGACDIEVRVLDANGLPVEVIGKVSFRRQNLTSLPKFTMGDYADYIIELNNGYSLFTSKDVYVVIRAYIPVHLMDDPAFKVVAIGLWVSSNIVYVRDPYGLEYVAKPRDTLRIKTGDCDDIAVLLVSMYRSVGLRSSVGLIDTDGDRKTDHATALVYVSNEDKETFESRLRAFAHILGGRYTGYSYFSNSNGIWLIVDPPMSTYENEPWRIGHEPYLLVSKVE